MHKRRAAAGAGLAMGLAAGVLPLGSTGGAAAQVPATNMSSPAIFHEGTWYQRDEASTGTAHRVFRYGTAGDVPVMGDWDGDGVDTVGVVRASTGTDGVMRYVWHLRNSNSAGAANVVVTYGVAWPLFGGGTVPVVGDWDGDGDDTPGIVEYPTHPDGQMLWRIRNSLSAGTADSTTGFSRGFNTPVVGDWDGDGDDNVGVVTDSDRWLLSDKLGGTADHTFTYGSQAIVEVPVVGDWDGDGDDTPAVLRNNPTTDFEGGFETWLLRNEPGGGGATNGFTFGSDAFTIWQPSWFIPRMSFS